MKLSGQIKALRAQQNLSQEELAERIYVSRQTISNWETEKSYPDIQSLLMLGALFDVSLDVLVKGDIEMMKKTVDASKMNAWSWVMMISLVVSGLTLLPAYRMFDFWGLIIPMALAFLGLAASLVLERYKSKNNVQTYSEILSFMEEKPLDEEKNIKEHKKLKGTKILMAIGAAVGMIALIVLGDFIYRLIAGI